MGKGGVSGNIGFPGYIEDYHEQMLTGGGDMPFGTSLTAIMTSSMDTGTLFSGTFGSEFWNNVVVTSPAVALSETESRLAQLDAVIDALNPKGDWCMFIKEAAAKIDSCISRDIDSEKIIDTALIEAAELITTFFSDLKSLHGINPVTDYGTYVDAAVAKADFAGVLNTIDLSAGVTAARAGADAEIAAAIAAAQDAAIDAIIDDLKDAYETRQESTIARQVRRFMGSMVDTNSIHGSAFVMGLALLYNDHQRDVGDFHTKVTYDLFAESVRGHIQSYLGQLDLEARADIEDKMARDRFVLNGIESISRILALGTGYEQQILNIFALTFARQAEIHLRALLGNKSSRDQLVGQGVEVMARMLSDQIRYEESATRLFGEIKRMRIVATREYESYLFDIDKRRALWNLDVWQLGASILGAPAGMSAVLPKEPSAAASALGGALGGAGTGALIGSAVPGIGTVAGAGIGALLGGLGGLLQ